MTLLGRILGLFPLFHMLSIGLAGWLYPYVLPLAIYAIPLFFNRIHAFFYPVREGISRLDLPIYSAWWGCHQFQSLFNAFPFLETPLRLIPGAYSFWLRCWGSSIGKNVYWTARIEVVDRHLVELGDHVIVGHKVILSAHSIYNKRGKTYLFIRRIKIGSQCIIGADSKLGPGTQISDGQFVPFQTVLTVNKRLG